MKKKKLDLDSLKVSSFVTSYSEAKSRTLKGGNRESIEVECPFGPPDDTLDFDCTVENPKTFQPGGTC